MIEKRFTVYGKEIVQDDECWAVAYSKYNADVIATALNELIEENQVLKQSQASTLREFEKGTKKIQQLAKENKELKLQNGELLYQIGEVGKNNKTCRECECFISKIKYCYMWDMEVEADDVVVACDQRKVKNTKEMMSDD